MDEPTAEASETKERRTLSVPMAIIVAGLIIGGAIIYTQGGGAVAKNGNQAAQVAKVADFRPITSEDHLRGNPKAQVVIVEYSDTECPFCKRFHDTMNTVMETYGKRGQVAWVYRHLPLEQLHKKARKEAEATECASEIGGKDKFWEYLDMVFAHTPSNDGLDLALLPKFAEDIGLDKNAFIKCLESGKMIAKIERDVKDAIAIGAQGTPYPIIIDTKTKNIEVLQGAVPYSELKTVYLDAMLGTK